MAETQNIDATEGSLVTKSLRIAWPAVAQAILVNFYAFNDFLFVGLLGDEKATAALSACFAIVVINYTALRVISTGATTLVSQYFGSGRRRDLIAVLRQALSSQVLWSLTVGAIGWLALPVIVAVSNATPAVGLRIADYLAVFYWGAPLFGLVMVVVGAFRACGNTRVPLALEIGSLALNVLLNYLLVLGPGPFPSLGITGAAVATVASRGLPGIVGLYLIVRGDLGLELVEPETSWRDWTPEWQRLRTMFRIGAFQSASGFIYGSVYFILNRMAGEIGPAAQGGLGAGLRGIEWVGYAVADGFRTATMAVVGQNVGAQKFDRAYRGALTNAAMSAIACQLVGLAFLVAPQTLSGVVTDDPQTLTYAAEYVGTIGWVMWCVGIEMATYGALIGTGRTQVSLAISGGMNLLRIPIAAAALFGIAALPGALGWALLGTTAPPLAGGFTAIAYTIAGTALIKALLLGGYVTTRLSDPSTFVREDQHA